MESLLYYIAVLSLQFIGHCSAFVGRASFPDFRLAAATSPARRRAGQPWKLRKIGVMLVYHIAELVPSQVSWPTTPPKAYFTTLLCFRFSSLDIAVHLLVEQASQTFV